MPERGGRILKYGKPLLKETAAGAIRGGSLGALRGALGALEREFDEREGVEVAPAPPASLKPAQSPQRRGRNYAEEREAIRRGIRLDDEELWDLADIIAVSLLHRMGPLTHRLSRADLVDLLKDELIELNDHDFRDVIWLVWGLFAEGGGGCGAWRR